MTGTNYWLRLNVSCPDYAFPDTLQLEATIYDPLDNTTRPTVGGCLYIPTVGWMTAHCASTAGQLASDRPIWPPPLQLTAWPICNQGCHRTHPPPCWSPAPQIGLSVLEQPEGPPEGFDALDSIPQQWIAIPDDAALFQDLPYEREDLIAAAPAEAAGEAPAPAPGPDDSGSEEELPAEGEVDPTAQGEGTDEEQLAAEQQAAEEQQQRR